jgi:hypothetical protein
MGSVVAKPCDPRAVDAQRIVASNSRPREAGRAASGGPLPGPGRSYLGGLYGGSQIMLTQWMPVSVAQQSLSNVHFS